MCLGEVSMYKSMQVSVCLCVRVKERFVSVSLRDKEKMQYVPVKCSIKQHFVHFLKEK